MERPTAFLERNSLFLKIYAAMLFALFVPILLFNLHRSIYERNLSRTGENDIVGKLHNWSTKLSEQADKLPPESLSAWIALMEQENDMQLYVLRDGITFHAEESVTDHASRDSRNPLLEDVSESGHTRVIVTLRSPRQRPHAGPLIRNVSILTVAVGGIVLSFLIVRSFMAPIAELRRATSKFAEGNLSVRADKIITAGSTEIGDLAASFNWMAERVEDLITSQKRLLVDISHEIRSPLQRLYLTLDIVRRNNGGDIEPCLNQAELEIKRIENMVEELLTLTLPTPYVVKSAPVNIETILLEIIDEAEFVGSRQKKAIETEIEPLVVRGDASLLKRAIGNIVHNAIRHTPVGTAVHIAASRDDAFTLVKITDAGLGVPEKELEKIFIPYYRTDLARERTLGGVGLGLAISKRLVEEHGGTIAAANAPSGGLIISVRLPLISEK